MSFSDVGSTMSSRPDRPLVVKATFDRYNKRITFSSARNCSYDLLRQKVEQSFALSAFSFSIAYKDDDGEVTDITTDADLTEAIHYFQAGVDDIPVSSTQSILSGRSFGSFGSRRITLRVDITVDYDGPSLSDTSSLVSLEEYRNRSGSELSLSFDSSVHIEPEDDSVTVSSRDTGLMVRSGELKPSASGGSSGKGLSTVIADQEPNKTDGGSIAYSALSERELAAKYPADPSAVFERLKLSENSQLASTSDLNERSAQWLRDQRSRGINGILAGEDSSAGSESQSVSDVSESDASSLSLEMMSTDDPQSPLDGDLALQQDTTGKYYYTYTSSSSSRASQFYEQSFADDEASYGIGEHEDHKVAECSAPKLHWIASQQTLKGDDFNPLKAKAQSYPSSSHRPSMHTSVSDPGPRDSMSLGFLDPSIPLEVLQFINPSPNPQPPAMCTDCSNCGVYLDSIRYVCSTCGEKTAHPRFEPMHQAPSSPSSLNGNSKGKERDLSMFDPLAYPPPSHRTPVSSTASSSSLTVFADLEPLGKSLTSRPLPALPLPTGKKLHSPSSSSLSSSPSLLHSSSSSTLASSLSSGLSGGFELCANCIESAGVDHAATESLSDANGEPSSPEDAQRTLSQLRRSAPRHKGDFRHAYLEKVWSASGWTDVEQDNSAECTICASSLTSQRYYKCASCMKFILCRSCYSVVHEIHPSHAFLLIPEPPLRSRSEPDLDLLTDLLPEENLGEQSLTHQGIKCAHCFMDIVGARFHCAICESVDICANCEAAGLPGNLDAPDGGHNSSHIMIKIPIPLNSAKVQTASRRALQLWTGRDGPNVQGSTNGHSPSSSLLNGDAGTVIGSGTTRSRCSSHASVDDLLDHHTICKGCGENIFGLRYQCATCPSSALQNYSLCDNCEPRSYILHDPTHIFFKLNRPVDRPIESSAPILPAMLYKEPAGPPLMQMHTSNPKTYLKSLNHTAALCDRCMEMIKGEWFRCVYCAKDLCDVCEGLDAHNRNHFFFVFKAPVNMGVFRHFAQLDARSSPPVLSYPVYNS